MRCSGGSCGQAATGCGQSCGGCCSQTVLVPQWSTETRKIMTTECVPETRQRKCHRDPVRRRNGQRRARVHGDGSADPDPHGDLHGPGPDHPKRDRRVPGVRSDLSRCPTDLHGVRAGVEAATTAVHRDGAVYGNAAGDPAGLPMRSCRGNADRVPGSGPLGAAGGVHLRLRRRRAAARRAARRAARLWTALLLRIAAARWSGSPIRSRSKSK